MQLIDAHIHLDQPDLIQVLCDHQISATINCDSPAEFKQNSLLTSDNPRLMLSAGIHPWKVDQVTFEEMLPVLKKVPVIGEIGLDNVWTKNSLVLQQSLFEKQLSYAKKAHKPVIIHTKGVEEITYKILKKFPNTYLIHWYSSSWGVEQFLELGCYFSIGPSFQNESSVQKLMQMIPLDRVLIESDGLTSIRWALDHDFSVAEYVPFMEMMVQNLAQIHGLTPMQMSIQLQSNLQSFWNHSHLF